MTDLPEPTTTTQTAYCTSLVDATKNSWASPPTQTTSADTTNFDRPSQRRNNIVEEGIRR